MVTKSLAARLSLAGFVALFFAIAFSYLLRAGRLTLVPIYDDVLYLNDAIHRLTYLDAGGILSFLHSFTLMPAHSPVLAIIGTLGFLFGAGQFGAPYAFNAIWLIVMTLLAWRVLKDLPDWSRVGIIVAMFAAPMFGYLISEFRPDIAWGLLVGFCAAWLATADLARLSYRSTFGIGIVIGIALLTKPTGMPAALVVLGMSMVMQFSLCFLQERRTGGSALLKRFAIMTIGAAALLLPYLFYSWRHVWEYVYAAMVTNKEVWTTERTPYQHATFYLIHYNGIILLGWIWYACLPVWLTCGAVLVYQKRYDLLARFGALLATVFVAYLIPTLSAMKTFHIGSILYGPIIATTVWALGVIVAKLSLPSRLVVTLGAVVFLIAWTPRAGNIGDNNGTARLVNDASRAVFQPILDKMRTRSLYLEPMTILFTVPGPVYDATIEFWARQHHQAATYISGYHWNSWEEFAAGIAKADIVVAVDPGISSTEGWAFQSFRFQAQLIEALSHDPAFEAQRPYTNESGHSVWLFIRKSSFSKPGA